MLGQGKVQVRFQMLPSFYDQADRAVSRLKAVLPAVPAVRAGFSLSGLLQGFTGLFRGRQVRKALLLYQQAVEVMCQATEIFNQLMYARQPDGLFIVHNVGALKASRDCLSRAVVRMERQLGRLKGLSDVKLKTADKAVSKTGLFASRVVEVLGLLIVLKEQQDKQGQADDV